MTTQTELAIGFMPLLDCALLVVAAEKGFAERNGLKLRLVRESSWANIRDRVAVGHFDAAQMLGPMVVAETLGAGQINVPLIAPVALGLGGNAITVSRDLWTQMRDCGAATGRRAGSAGTGTGTRHREAQCRRRCAAGPCDGVSFLLPQLRAALLAGLRRRGSRSRCASRRAASAAAGGRTAKWSGGWILRGRTVEQRCSGSGPRRDRSRRQRHLALGAGKSRRHAC